MNRSGYLCIKCNFTIHTKYCRADTDPIFAPNVNLQCVDKILIVANGFIHMVSVDLNLNKQIKPFSNSIDIKYVRTQIKTKPDITLLQSDDVINDSLNAMHATAKFMKATELKAAKETTNMSSNDDQQQLRRQEPRNIVETIIADFAECETDVTITEKQQQQQQQQHSRVNTQNNFNELIIMCRNNIDKPTKNKVKLLNHRGNRIISKNVNTIKNNITKVDLSASQTTATIPSSSSNGLLNKNLDKAAKAYEFSEDNEKCEKISTFRKRRLADKKYEFSEDNTENIIPYNRMRSVIRNPTIHQKISRHSTAQTNGMNYSSSPPTNYEISTSYHTHRASPSYGFRSPCGSPVGNRFIMMSPPSELLTFLMSN